MAIRKLCSRLLVSYLLSYAILANAYNPLGQTIQIHTALSSIVGRPSWLIIIRDINNGQVLPYLFDITDRDNVRVFFTFGQAYQITASHLQFNDHTLLSNFCGLNGSLFINHSLFITIKGKLTPNPNTFHCNILSYIDTTFTIAPPTENSEQGQH